MSDTITNIAKHCGAIVSVDGRDVWANANGDMLKKLMMLSYELGIKDVIDICDRKPHLYAGGIAQEAEDLL